MADAVLAASRSPRSRPARGHRPSGPLGVALAASWLGDVALLSRSDPALLGGIAGFTVAHLSYLIEMRRRFPVRRHDLKASR
jgi:uncharacterized membrane protein YhhN